MNKEIYEIVKERRIHPISYEKEKKVYIVKDQSRNYVIKLGINNYDIYKYLLSRDFLDIPKFLNNKNTNYDLYFYIDDYSISYIQRVNDLIKELAFLHHKTSYQKETNIDEIKKFYTKEKDNILQTRKYYYELNDLIDQELFLSPSMYLLARNISLFYYMLDYALDNLEKWYEKEKEEKNVRVSLLHNNVDISHLIINEHRYLISWDKAYFDNPINDLLSFYKKYYKDLSLAEVLNIYEETNKLTKLEKKLLFIKLSIPKIIKISKNTFDDTKRINEEISFLKKVYDIIKIKDEKE